MKKDIRFSNTGYALVSFFAALTLLNIQALKSEHVLLALILSIFVHECSHFIALALLGFRVRNVSLQPMGLCISYGGMEEEWKHALAALAGPVGGLLYVPMCMLLQRKTGLDWFCRSGDLSLLLSLFNLLPIQPLDGGRFLRAMAEHLLGEERGDAFAHVTGGALLAALLVLGIALSILKMGNACIAAGLWLLLMQKEQLPLVKEAELL